MDEGSLHVIFIPAVEMMYRPDIEEGHKRGSDCFAGQAIPWSAIQYKRGNKKHLVTPGHASAESGFAPFIQPFCQNLEAGAFPCRPSSPREIPIADVDRARGVPVSRSPA